MELIDLDPTFLQPNPWNSNVVTADNQERLQASIEHLGLFKPIIVREIDGGHQILGGENRREQALLLGHATVPCLNLGVIDDIKAKEISLADNIRYGSDDGSRLAAILADLGDINELTARLPISDVDLTTIMSAATLNPEDLEIPEDTITDAEDILNEPSLKPSKTHETIRFRVPIEDASRVRDIIKRVQDKQDFNDEDAASNAGNALVHILFNQTRTAQDAEDE